MHDHLREQRFWQEAWMRHLELYLATPPRAGLWLAARFDLSHWSVLEIAGGSCRDSRHLADRGVDAIGTDFDAKTLAYLAQRFPSSPLKMRREDALALTLADGSVDLSMHNGFWVLYADDAQVMALMREQARVTRKVLVAIVHNAANRRLASIFKRMAQSDPLYDIRFFDRHELKSLVQAAGVSYQRMKIEKFGGPVDILLRLPGPLGRWAKQVVPRLYRWLPWSQVERVVLVLEF